MQLLARHGRAAAVGFIDPEEYYDPFEFLEELERRGSIAVECNEAPVQPDAESTRTRA